MSYIYCIVNETCFKGNKSALPKKKLSESILLQSTMLMTICKSKTTFLSGQQCSCVWHSLSFSFRASCHVLVYCSCRPFKLFKLYFQGLCKWNLPQPPSLFVTTLDKDDQSIDAYQTVLNPVYPGQGWSTNWCISNCFESSFPNSTLCVSEVNALLIVIPTPIWKGNPPFCLAYPSPCSNCLSSSHKDL